MVKSLRGLFCLSLLCCLVSVYDVAIAEEIYKVDNPINVKIGDNDWEVKVASYTERPYNKDLKTIDLIINYANTSAQKKIQAIDPGNWSFYVLGSDGGSYKADSLNYKREPGNNNWWGKEDVLPGTRLAVKIPVNLPKSVAAKQAIIMGDVAIPSQIVVDIPSSIVSKPLAVSAPAGEAGPTSTAYAAQSQSYTAQSQPAKPYVPTLEDEATAGYGAIAGNTIGVSGIYWVASPLGGQVILALADSNSLKVNARLLMKFFVAPFGRLYLGPQVGYQFTVQGNISKTSYGYLGGAEFIMPMPVTVAGGKNIIKTQNEWLSFLAFEKAKAIGLSAELGFYGTNIRQIELDPQKLTPGFNMAAHIYL